MLIRTLQLMLSSPIKAHPISIGNLSLSVRPSRQICNYAPTAVWFLERKIPVSKSRYRKTHIQTCLYELFIYEQIFTNNVNMAELGIPLRFRICPNRSLCQAVYNNKQSSLTQYARGKSYHRQGNQISKS